MRDESQTNNKRFCCFRLSLGQAAKVTDTESNKTDWANNETEKRYTSEQNNTHWWTKMRDLANFLMICYNQLLDEFKVTVN